MSRLLHVTQHIPQRFDRLQTRERILLFAASITLLIFLFSTFIYRPIFAQIKAEKEQQESVKIQREQLLSELALLQARQTMPALTPEHEQLLQDIQQVRATVLSHTAQMIPPEQLLPLLHALLRAHPGVSITGLHKPNPAQLVDQTESAATQFKHPIVLQLRGQFFAIVNYLQAVEKAEWKLQWNSLHYRVSDYPTAEVEIQLATYSQTSLLHD